MKKTVGWALLLFLLSGMLSGCAHTSTGSAAELRQYNWRADPDGGGSLTLCFEGENASLTMENGGESETIAGRFLADDSTLIIFDDSVSQSYRFGYVPNGDRLALTYGGNTVELIAM